jgi:hypothetical protein
MLQQQMSNLSAAAYSPVSIANESTVVILSSSSYAPWLRIIMGVLGLCFVLVTAAMLLASPMLIMVFDSPDARIIGPLIVIVTYFCIVVGMGWIAVKLSQSAMRGYTSIPPIYRFDTTKEGLLIVIPVTVLLLAPVLVSCIYDS